MKRPLNEERDEELNYWQSISDIMVALLLIVLLVLMLFILYMTRVPDRELTDGQLGDDYGETDGETYDDDRDRDYGGIHWLTPGERPEPDTSGGGGGGGQPVPVPDSDPGELDGTDKAAVHVTVIDGETGRTIEEAGITFVLYREGTLQTLCTYYPERIAYESFETTEEGTFYLPEKILHGAYRLSERSVPYTYDRAEDLTFSVSEAHDWDEPIRLTVPLYPCMNTIRLQNEDSLTRRTVGGGSYDVIAAEDIITPDGTLRYEKGQIVDRIVCDETGFGESSPLYLGGYLLRQLTAPEFYAAAAEDISVQLLRKGDEPAPALALPQERTAFSLSVYDELYPDRPLAAAFTLRSQDGSAALTDLRTDAAGTLLLDELRRDTAYTLLQTETETGFRLPETVLTFTVTGDGRIDGAARKTVQLTNRKIRTAILTRDKLLPMEVSNRSLALYDAAGELVHLWTSSAAPEEIDGLAPGSYTLMLNGKTAYPITVADTAEIQRFTCAVWTALGVTLAALGGLIAAAALFILIKLLHRSAKRRKEAKDHA